MISLGDLAQSFMLRQQNLHLRQDMNRLSQEMTTGRVTDPARHLSGDYSYLADMERSLGVLDGFRTSVTEAGVFTAGMQTVLDHVQSLSSDLGLKLIGGANGGASDLNGILSRDAAGQMDRIVEALNTRIAGRSLFAGNATDRPALAPASDILAGLRAAIGGQTTVAGIQAAVDLWFDTPGGGFDTVAYTGSATGLSPYRLGRTGTVDLDLRADSPALREVLKQTAIAALADDGALALTAQARADLLRQAGEGIVSAQDRLTTLRADLGFAEARIEEGKVRLASEKTSLEMARNALLSVDPFEAATRFQEAQSRLENLYMVTVRLSRLSLAEFMR